MHENCVAYNLTWYILLEISKYTAICGMKHKERRGSCEIATCLMKNTMSVCLSSKDVKHITYYSDTCGGQNRNRYVATSLMYVLSKLPKLEIIEQKFLQSGHSQMEWDSVHATIETAKKITSVYVPSQWGTVVSLARKKHPYIVVPLKYEHVLDWKKFASTHCHNLKTGSRGEKINWLHIKWIQVRQTEPKSIFVNYSFNENTFLEMKTQSVSTRRKKVKEMEWPSQLDFCYQAKLPVTAQKKADLVSLCKKGVIPDEFQAYYRRPTDQ